MLPPKLIRGGLLLNINGAEEFRESAELFLDKDLAISLSAGSALVDRDWLIAVDLAEGWG